MELQYSAATCFLSIAMITLCAPFACRSRRQKILFSGALGIIIYRIVKSIIVECGWEFAAIAALPAGLLAEAAAMGFGVFLFVELDRLLRKKSKQTVLSAVGVVMLFAGKWVMYEYILIPDATVFIVGKAVELALLSYAVYINKQEESGQNAVSLAAFGVACTVGSFAAGRIAALLPKTVGSFAAPLIVMFGCCELLTEVVSSVKKRSAISAWGFACGLMLSCCIDSMTG